jgi:hypothetical protein
LIENGSELGPYKVRGRLPGGKAEKSRYPLNKMALALDFGLENGRVKDLLRMRERDEKRWV